MTSYSAAQLAWLADKAGWGTSDRTVAVAVALAESGGNPNAHNTSHGADARGLWQINVSSNAHPEYASQNLYDGMTNAQAAHDIWSKSGWGPWSAHNNGSYLLYMPIAAAGVATEVPISAYDAVSGAVTGAAQTVLSPVQSLTNEATTAIKFVEDPNTWIRFAKWAVGASLIVVALAIAAKPIIEPAAQTATKVAGVAAMA